VQQLATTMMDGRRSPPNPAAKDAYRFTRRPEMAGEPAGLDPAQISLGQARSGLSFVSYVLFI
jgi:hypothetical protein